MVFMSDSERAAEVAREQCIDVGLHLNFTMPFSAPNCAGALLLRQRELASCLLRHRTAQALFHPTLIQSFEYVVSAQIEEFHRIYGKAAERFDGHHHMHLCLNVLLGRLLPNGAAVRRNFTFLPTEKGLCNRLYRRFTDYILASRHRVTDYFFSLSPIEPLPRLERIFELASRFVVEVETHPNIPAEYRFLAEGGLHSMATRCQIASRHPLSFGDHS
jgi:predicted glycoside hydrolase/deacetylase ChbG (UPF0249 family)